MTAIPPELLQGTVDVLILRALQEDALHGYAINRWLSERSDGRIVVNGAALYQALHRLEHRGLVAASWGLSENNRKAKYYRLTARGRKRLEAQSSAWSDYAHAVFRVLAPEGGER